MPKKDIRTAVKWVKTFKLVNVKGDPDNLHEKLNDLTHLIIQNLPLVSDQATYYQEKLNELKILLRKEWVPIWEKYNEIKKEVANLKKEINKNENYINLLNNINFYIEKIEDEKLPVAQVDRKTKLLYEALIRHDYHNEQSGEEPFDVLLNHLDRIPNVKNELRELKEDYKVENEKFFQVCSDKEKISGKISQLYNDLRVMQENCFKGLGESKPPTIVTEFTPKNGKPTVVDHSIKTVESLQNTDKYFSENLVAANITFIVNLGNSIKEISVPVKIPSNSIVNLSIFKSAEFMSLSLDKKYNSSNEFLKKQIERRYNEGAKKKNIILKNPTINSQSFSHSEQALFCALERLDVITLILKRLKAALPSNFNIFFIENIIIDLHTTRYMCDSCSISGIGVQNGAAILSLFSACISKNTYPIIISDGCNIHIRASAVNNFETKKKLLEDHDDTVVVSSETISQKDLRIDNRRDNNPYISSLLLSRELQQYTFFTSGDTECQKFKTAYARAINPAIKDATLRIEKQFIIWRKKGKPGSKSSFKSSTNSFNLSSNITKRVTLEDIKKFGGEVKDAGGKGDCLFRAINAALTSQGPGHIQLRAEAVKTLKDQQTAIITSMGHGFFKEIVKTAKQELIPDGIEHYFTLMSEPGTWGGMAEIKALSHVLLRPIFLFSDGLNGQFYNKFDYDLKGNMLKAEPLLLYYTNNNHFCYILPQAGKSVIDIIKAAINFLDERDPISPEIWQLGREINKLLSWKKYLLIEAIQSKINEEATEHVKRIKNTLNKYFEDKEIFPILNWIFSVDLKLPIKNSPKIENSNLKTAKSLMHEQITLKYGYEIFSKIMRVLERNGEEIEDKIKKLSFSLSRKNL